MPIPAPGPQSSNLSFQSKFRRGGIGLLALAFSASVCALGAGTATAAASGSGDRPGTMPSTYQLTGDPEGSTFEGIAVAPNHRTFYVSEVTGGEIHRSQARPNRSTADRDTEWLAGDGTDGRWTARGLTVDRAGRIYVAGGPNGIDHPGAPDLWVYSPGGELLAALRMPGDEVFVNDVVVGPDGTVYATNSNDPEVYRIARGADGWSADLLVDASDTVSRQPGFNFNGIEVSPDRSALVVAQSATGQLWRIDLTSSEVSEVAGGVLVPNADGLVKRGNQLAVVQNFVRLISTVELSADGTHARLLHRVGTDPDRVFTTGARIGSRLLLVDSEFGPEGPEAPYEVVTRAWAR